LLGRTNGMPCDQQSLAEYRGGGLQGCRSTSMDLCSCGQEKILVMSANLHGNID